jgi:diacylglycerol kinase
MVEEMLNPGAVMMAVLEELMNQAIGQVVDTHADKRRI